MTEEDIFHPHRERANNENHVGSQLARSTRNLEDLCISWNVDASDFFRELPASTASLPDSPESGVWSNLERLSLTCSALQPGDTPLVLGKQRAVIQAACKAASKMPKLRFIQLWDCERGSGAIFQWTARDAAGRRPAITFETTWTMPFEPEDEIFDSWRKLARHPWGEELFVGTSTVRGLAPYQLSPWRLLPFLRPEFLHPASRASIEAQLRHIDMMQSA